MIKNEIKHVQERIGGFDPETVPKEFETENGWRQSYYQRVKVGEADPEETKWVRWEFLGEGNVTYHGGPKNTWPDRYRFFAKISKGDE